MFLVMFCIMVFVLLAGIAVSIYRWQWWQKRYYQTKQELIAAEAELKTQQQQQLWQEHAQQQLKSQFGDLSEQILQSKSDALRKQTAMQWQTLLAPLQAQLRSFDEKVTGSHQQGIQMHAELVAQVKCLQSTNKQLGDEAQRLAHALRGDRKKQGLWGELVLQRILEISGLRCGREYDTQVVCNDGEHKLIPDVVVYLPEERLLVIDAKVSLSAFERYQNSEDQQQEQALSEHIHAVRQHIKELSKKQYQKLFPKKQTLDFVLLFMPVESALAVAVMQDEQLLQDALQQQVVLVTPTTLVSTLRTVEYLWRLGEQSKHAQQIAQQAGSLYDKLVGFVEDMQDVSRRLHGVQQTHERAINKLSTGRGNVITRVEKLRELGVKTQKSLPKEWVEKEEENNE